MTQPLSFSDIDEQDLSELDRLLNDPEVPMEADRVWDLLDKVSGQASRSAA